MTGKEETAEDQQREYQLPDGEKIMIGNSKFKAPEILFKPERKLHFYIELSSSTSVD